MFASHETIISPRLVLITIKGTALKVQDALLAALSLPKTLLINLRLFPLSTAIKLPIFVRVGSRVSICRGGVVLEGKPRPGLIRMGFNRGSFGVGESRTLSFHVEEGGVCRFSGTASFAAGDSVFVGREGELFLGDGFTANAGLILSCGNHIEFGGNCMLGWSCTVIDGDGHKTSTQEKDSSIVIGDHVWLAAETAVLKGSKIPSNSIVAFRSTVTGDFAREGEGCLIASPKARVVRKGCGWS